MVGLLLLAFALRTYALGVRELTFDEIASVFIAVRGPLHLLTYLRDAIREHPPFYYLLLSLWMPLAGQSEFAVRFLSVIIGLTTVAAMYRLALKTTHQPAALLAAFLLVISPFHIAASQNARMYGLLALFSLLSIFFFVRLLAQDRARWWGLFWLVTGLGMFTHYYMAFVLLAEDLFLLLNWRRYRRLWPRWMAIHLALVGMVALWAALSPGLWATLLSFWHRGAASHVRWEDFFRVLNGLYLGATLSPNWLHLALPLALTVLGIHLAQWRNLWPVLSPVEYLPRGYRHGGLLLALLLGVPLIVVLALPERVTGRYLTAALPAAILAMSLALSWLVGLLVGWLVKWPVVHWSLSIAYCSLVIVNCSLIIGLVFVNVSAYPLIYFPPGQNFRARIEYLRAHAHPDDGLLLHGPWQALLLTYYDPGPLKRYTIKGAPAEEILTGIFDTHDRVWVSYGSVEPVDPDWIVSHWLHEHTHQVWAEGDLMLYHAAPVQYLPESERVDVRFGEQLRLEDVALANLEPVSGEAVLLLTQWRALQDIPHGLILRLELVGPAGHVWGVYQFRAGPAHVPALGWSAGETFVERRGLVIPTGTPTGDYTLRVRVLLPNGDEWSPEGGPSDVGLVHVCRGGVTPPLPGRDLRATFGDTLALVGYEPWGQHFTQGNPLLFNLYWQALTHPPEDYELGIELMDGGGTVLAARRVQPVAKWFPTSRWQAGDVLKGCYDLPLPLDTPPGHYHIRLTIYAAGGSPLPVSGTLSGASLTLPDVEVDARSRCYRPPEMDYRLDVTLGDDVRLLGYDLATTSIEPGGVLELTLYWQALRQIEHFYAVFNHLIGPDGTVIAQADSWPQGGAYPTLYWLPNEVVEDSYTIPVPPDTPPGEYTLQVGMYDGATGERAITLVDGEPVPERQIVLTAIKVSR